MFAFIQQNLLRFFLLLFIQVLLVSNLKLSPYISPNIFPLFILMLPFPTPRWLLIVIGFLSGLVLDVFLGTIGMNAAATLLLAYIRPFLITLITPRGTEFDQSPNIFAQGFTWFFIYTSLSVLVHHSFFMLIESGTFYNLIKLLARVLASSAVSLLFMFIGLYLFSVRRKRKI